MNECKTVVIEDVCDNARKMIAGHVSGATTFFGMRCRRKTKKTRRGCDRRRRCKKVFEEIVLS